MSVIAAAPAWLTDAAVTAGAVTTLLGFVALICRLCLRFTLIRRFFGWIREGWAEDRAEALDKALAFNGTGRFRSDMREFYLAVNAFMAESAADRRAIHARLGQIQGEHE